jgi:hypothetical protein
MNGIVTNIYNVNLCSVNCPWRNYDDQIHGHYCRMFDVALNYAYRAKKCFDCVPSNDYILPKEMLKL